MEAVRTHPPLVQIKPQTSTNDSNLVASIFRYDVSLNLTYDTATERERASNDALDCPTGEARAITQPFGYVERTESIVHRNRRDPESQTITQSCGLVER
jgi:hypothetical protein